MTKPETQLKTLEPSDLDAIADRAIVAFSAGGGGAFSVALAAADAIEQLRAAFTPLIMARVRALADTTLGFRTDKDPKQFSKKTNKFNEPYSDDVVKDCAIEAVLRGVNLIGNQFNIIANRCYITQEGFDHKLKGLNGLSGLKTTLAVPSGKMGGAIVACTAEWQMHGKNDRLACDIAIKTDEYSGSDQILGKARRKLLKRIWEQATGRVEPDGDVTDTVDVEPRFYRKPEISQAPPETPQTANADDGDLAPQPEDSEKLHTVQESLAELIIGWGFSFDDFSAWADGTGNIRDAGSIGSFSELPTEICRRLIRSQTGLRKGLEMANGRAK